MFAPYTLYLADLCGIEEWRKIADHPMYDVSSIGRVRSWKPYRNFAPPPTQPRLMCLRLDKDGYPEVGLNETDKIYHIKVHNLVCTTWHGARPDGAVIRHLDGVRHHNFPNNLSWGTPLENSKDSRIHGTWVHGAVVNTARLSDDDVHEILRSDSTNTELANKYGVTKGAIWHIRDGRTWKHVARP